MSRLNLSRNCLAACIVAGCWCAAAQAEAVVFARDLALSPDGQTLAFAWAGDIWTVAASGGQAHRLTVHPANEGDPVFSPDGQWLAFSSDRGGAANVYVTDRNGQEFRRLTFSDRPETPTSWSPDGKFVYFYSRLEGDVSRQPRMYRVPAAGGQVWRALDCHGGAPRLNKAGDIVFQRGSAVEWRRNYRGSGNFDVYVYTPATQQFTQLTEHPGNDRLPMWDGAGQGVYYLSDRGGSVNVWYQPLGGAVEQVTKMAGDDVRDLAVSADGKTLAFTHWDKLYVMNTSDRRATEITVTAGGDMPYNELDRRAFTNDADEAEVSPSGDEVAFVVRGEIFVIKTEEKQPTRRVTQSAARDQQVTWSPDGKALFFVSDEVGQEDIYRAVSAEDPPKALSDSLRFKIERVTDDPAIETEPRLSPDGKQLAFVRGLGDLIIRDLENGKEQALLTGWARPQYRWSPDSRYIAYAREDAEFNSDVWVMPADGAAPAVNISQHPDNDTDPQWSADGQIVAFVSRRDGFDSDLYLAFLSEQLDEKPAIELAAYFKEQGEAVKKRKPLEKAVASGKIALAGQPAATQPTSQPEKKDETAPATTTQPTSKPAVDPLRKEIGGLLRYFLDDNAKAKDKHGKGDKAEADKKKEKYRLDTCWRRIRRVTSLPADQERFALSPAGSEIAFASSHDGESRVYTIAWDGTDVKRILGSAAGALHWTLDGKRLFYLQRGVPGSCTASGSDTKSHGFRAPLVLDYAAQARQKFDDGARALGQNFYHPTLKGLDWEALTEKYRTLALKTRTIGEFNQIFNLLLGELNASHLGIYGGRWGEEPRSERYGYLGCTFDPEFPGPGLKVASVLPYSPADNDESRLVPGDVLLKVNGEAVGPDAPLDAALIDTVGDETIIEYLPAPDRAAKIAAATQPASALVSAPTAEPTTAPASAPAPQQLVIRPVSFGTYADVAYDAWVSDNRAFVDAQSGGRVGYLHIRSMDERSFAKFERDLYAAAHGRDGLIIDVRSNGGGWTADWVLAVLTVKRHAYTIPRGGTQGYPQDRLIFYSWTQPATMLCNDESFSNAEIISHAFKNLKRGPLVGTPTHGGVISTGGYNLVDGSLVRMPFRGWYTMDGTDMENHGAVPDVIVLQTPTDEVTGKQAQLAAAVRATLKQLPAASSTMPAPQPGGSSTKP